jgi:hypothetical protein
MTKKSARVAYQAPRFDAYLAPHGYFVDDPACHALFRYYLAARQNFENEHKGGKLVYEGNLDPKYNYVQLFRSVAQWYGVTPERMTKFWSNIDMQCRLLQLPLMPDEERYRFNRTTNVTVN